MTLDARDFSASDPTQDERPVPRGPYAADDEPTVLRVGRGAPRPASVQNDEITVLRVAARAPRRNRLS